VELEGHDRVSGDEEGVVRILRYCWVKALDLDPGQLSFKGALVWAKANEKGLRPGDDMGVEVDLLAKYAVTANVTVQAGFGYLSAGDFYGKNVDDPWVGTAHAVVTF
jgi:hypothetical protein